jgi:hypothetical protein
MARRGRWLRLAGASVVLFATAGPAGPAQLGILPPPDTTPQGALPSTVCPPGVIPGPTLSCVLLPANLGEFVVDEVQRKLQGPKSVFHVF